MTAPVLPSRWVISGGGPDTSDDPDVFPHLAGQSFQLLKTPLWSSKIDIAVSGTERRRALWSYPLYLFQLQHNVLRDAAANLELQRLVTFFNMKFGSVTGFFYYDRDDHQVTNCPFGTGDGVTTTFQAMRQIAIGSLVFSEPVRGFNGAPVIYDNGVLVNTNHITYSQDFDNASFWSKTNCTVTPNTTVAPDATTTADTMTRTALGNHLISQLLTGDWRNQQVTFSVYLKLGTLAEPVALRIRDYDGITEYGVTSTTPITGGFTRYSVTATIPPTASASGLLVYIDPGDTGPAGDTLFLWGAQLEFGASPGPYQATTIPYTFSLGAFGQINFTSPPPVGHVLTWTGSYFFLCRFAQDQLPLSKLASGLWVNGAFDFRTFKP